MEPRKQMGNTSEDIALAYLQEQGYQLVVRNFRCKTGEIDLILKKEQYLVFVEVRSRTGRDYGEPSESVNRKKQDKVRKTAQYYLYCNPQFASYYCRFDVISIVWEQGIQNLEWIKDAFM